MSNERPDEFLSWRTRLDTPDALPGLSLANKEDAWQRLQGRLQKKPVRRRFLWWSLAAAASVLLLILLRLPSAKTPPAQPSVARNPSASSPATVAPIVPSTARVAPAQHTAPATTVPNPTQPHYPPAGATASRSPASIYIAARRTGKLTALPSPSPADSVSVVSPAGQWSTAPLASNIHVSRQTIIPPKRLRVVSVNEIGGPLQTPVSMTANQRFFRIDLIRPGSSGPSPSAEDETDHSLKIKFTHSN